jgi:hypothetical protein
VTSPSLEKTSPRGPSIHASRPNTHAVQDEGRFRIEPRPSESTVSRRVSAFARSPLLRNGDSCCIVTADSFAKRKICRARGGWMPAIARARLTCWASPQVYGQKWPTAFHRGRRADAIQSCTEFGIEVASAVAGDKPRPLAERLVRSDSRLSSLSSAVTMNCVCFVAGKPALALRCSQAKLFPLPTRPAELPETRAIV